MTRGHVPKDVELALAVGARVRELRTLRGWTQAELASRSNLGRPNLARLEQGVHVPSLPVLRDVAHALGFDLASLLAGVDECPKPEADDVVRRTA
jgi:transcriptional regulator with XRE-family HTH domain